MSNRTLARRRARRIALAAVAVATLSALVLVAYAATAPTVSTTGAVRRGLHRTLLAAAVPLVVLTEGALVYAVVRFAGGDDSEPLSASRTLELGWTAAVGLVLLAVGALSYGAMLDTATVERAPDGTAATEDGIVVVHVTAEQWDWTFRYPAANATSDRLVLPVDRLAVFRIRSRDVVHSFAVPALAIKQDAFPGQYTYARTTPTRTGRYRVVCTEFCGVGHSKMRAPAAVVPRSAFRNWTRTGGVEPPPQPATRPIRDG